MGRTKFGSAFGRVLLKNWGQRDNRKINYHNAIRYERNGFGYMEGRKQMEEIDREFLPGGRLYERLDGSTPFRMKGAEKSLRGRSWAIKDGILGGPWTSPKIYKPVGKSVGLNTFHGEGF